MANPEHLEILKKGVRVWNEWKNQHGKLRPHYLATLQLTADLSGADLTDLELNDVNFDRMNLTRANFSGSKLIGASFIESYIQAANFRGADLSDANFDIAYISTGSGGYENATELNTKFSTSFENANLSWSSFSGAQLEGVSFKGSDLIFANFNNALLSNNDFSEAIFYKTALSGVDLSNARGLETVMHRGPSTIGVDTIYKSQGNIPEVFLQGCGMPEDFIIYMPSLTVKSIQFYASFISYSSKDQKFADRLYVDLQSKGVRCWLATEDLKIGAKIRTGIDEAIRLHDKLLLVLSKHSVASDWVEQEVETALERERKEKRHILFPIRLDDSVMKIEGGWPALVRNTRNIGDFRKWKDHNSYQKKFARLLHDLKTEEMQIS